ncbi:hypothetical protein HI914_06655 [Erysiphe necator]|nr:hypothetical protein HI914_06655 [Erysiphe necator]
MIISSTLGVVLRLQSYQSCSASPDREQTHAVYWGHPDLLSDSAKIVQYNTRILGRSCRNLLRRAPARYFFSFESNFYAVLAGTNQYSGPNIDYK